VQGTTADVRNPLEQGSSSGTGKSDMPLGSEKYATGKMPGTTASRYTTSPAHLDGANYLAVDGHVKWLRSTMVSPGVDAPTSTSTQVDGNTAAGTASMDMGAGRGDAALTFSKN